jgi:hypothetical protein
MVGQVIFGFNGPDGKDKFGGITVSLAVIMMTSLGAAT